MKIGDEVFVHGFVDEIRKDTVIIRNEGGYFGTVENEISAQPEIIRCRDCSHFHEYEWYCDAWNNSPGFPKVTEDGFCNLAERRIDED